MASSDDNMEEVISRILSKETSGHELVRVMEYFVEMAKLEDVDKIASTEGDKTDVYTELIVAAAKMGKDQLLEGVIQKVPDLNLNAVGDDNKTALITAAEHGHAKCVEVLVRAGADVDVAIQGRPHFSDGYTALMAACRQGHYECVDVLLQRNINVDSQNEVGATALTIAAYDGYDKCVKSLLRAGADVNIKNDYGDTAVHIAIHNVHPLCVEALTQAGADVNIKNEVGKTPLVLAIEVGEETFVDMLIKAGADVNTCNPVSETPLMMVTESNREEMLELLIEAGADVNKSTDDEENSNASDDDDDEEIEDDTDEENVDAGTGGCRRRCKKINGNTALTFAIEYEHIECAERLIKAGADVNVYKRDWGKTLLIYSADRGKVEIVEALIQGGADVNARDDENCTALLRAAYIVNTECVDLLLNAGADVNATNDDGETALIKVVSQSPYTGHHDLDIECFNKILQAGTDVNVADNAGWTALSNAANWGQYKYVKLLIQAGADVKESTSALRAAATISAYSNEKYKTLKVLLAEGARVNIMNEDHPNALVQHLLHSSPPNKRVSKLLYAAGEIIDGTTVPRDKIEKYLPQYERELNLRYLCREAIRKQLLNVDPNLNLFIRVPLLGLVSSLEEYMLYNISLDVETEEMESD